MSAEPGARSPVIAGIQQVGVGVEDAGAAFDWYRRRLGMDVRIFDEAAEAPLMTRYTGGTIHRRRAVLAINLLGGGGFELWQFTSRAPQRAGFEPQLGDLGILSSRVKARDVAGAHAQLSAAPGARVGPVRKDPLGRSWFWLLDLAGNLLQVVEGEDWFGAAPGPVGGVAGCSIGVSDVERSLALYRDVLGFDRVLYDEERTFDDLRDLPGGGERLRRVLLGHSAPREGAFSRLLGAGQLELLSAPGRAGRRIFADRFWGDLGFIHLCFDVAGMDALEVRCAQAGFRFTIDSGKSFDMGEAAGRFAYLEDPDGTLIELVETHRVPVLRKLGLYFDLRRRDPRRPLPSLMLRALAFNRVK